MRSGSFAEYLSGLDEASVTGLPRPARTRLDQLRHGYGGYYPGMGPRAPGTLAVAGLAVRVHGRWEMPPEVGVAAWLAQRELLLTGRSLSLPSAGSRSRSPHRPG